MKKIIYLICLLVLSNGVFSQINSPNGDNIFYYDGAADVIFKYPLRGTGGRAFVHYPNNMLSINYNEDFTGGTLIGKNVFFKDNGNSYISSGNFGIGTNAPNARLHVSGGDIVINKGGIGILRGNNSDYGSGGALKVSSSNTASEQYIQLGRAFSGTGEFFPHLTIMANNENVGIGATNPQNKLDVNGTIHSREVKVDMDNWSDFVFKKEYNLSTLEQVEKHIAEKGHLENIPNEKEVLENGINLGEMNAKLLQKIEEMTLYIIHQNKQILDLNKRLEIVESK